MRLNNLNSTNLIPFKKEILNNKFSYKNFIYKEIPVIPGIYFLKKEDDPIGNKTINAFYNIQFNLQKLETTLKFILSILLTSKCILGSIKVSNNKYKLLKKNLLIHFSDNCETTFNNKNGESDFINFLGDYINNNYNILSNYKDNKPYFYKIFQTEYNETSKDYFLSIFNKYIEIRSNLLQYLKDYYGLNAFKFMFDISRNDIESNNINKNCNNKNYENYILNNKNNSNLNNNLEINDKVIINNNINEIGIIISIDYYGSPKDPYIVQTKNGEIKKYSLPALTKYKTDNENSLVKPTLESKIYLYDSLYYENKGATYYKNNHQKNINQYYHNLLTSINSSFDNQSLSLYEVLVNGLNMDMNLLKFLFYYVDKNLFNKAIDSYIDVNEYIFNNINSFESYYNQYIKWYNNLLNRKDFIGIITPISSDSNFKEYFDTLFSKLET